MRRSTVWVALVCVLVVPACDDEGGTSQPATSASPEPSRTDLDGADSDILDAPELPTPSPTIDQRICRADGLEERPLVLLTGSDPATIASRVARRTHRCAPTVVVAPDEGWAASLAVPVAAANDAPLLLVRPEEPPATAETLTALETTTVIGVGVDAAPTDLPGFQPLAPLPLPLATGDEAAAAPSGPRSPEVRLALLIADYLDTQDFIAIPHEDVRGRTAAALQADPRSALLPIPADDRELEDLARALPATARLRLVDGPSADAALRRILAVGLDAELVEGERWPLGDETSWLVDPDDPIAGAVAAVAAHGRGEALLPIDGDDLRAGVADAARLRETAPDRAVVVGAVTPNASWQYEVVRDGAPLPGGAFRLFDGERLIVLTDALPPGASPPDDDAFDTALGRIRELGGTFDDSSVRSSQGLELDLSPLLAGQTLDVGDPVSPADLVGVTFDRTAQEGLHLVIQLPDDTARALSIVQDLPELFANPHVGVSIAVTGDVDESPVLEGLQPLIDELAQLTRARRLPQKLLLVRLDAAAPLDADVAAVLAADEGSSIPPELAVVLELEGSSAEAVDEVAASDDEAEPQPWHYGWRYDVDDQQPEVPEGLLAADVAVITFS